MAHRRNGHKAEPRMYYKICRGTLGMKANEARSGQQWGQMVLHGHPGPTERAHTKYDQIS